tara:strand:- start:32135 stop:33052 length:918 start_codon:yes stop_codon:yes gene_type:complete
VAGAKNGTFLFQRDFMDYHKDRFEDFSLMVFKKNKLLAVLPLNKKEMEVYSHAGLTYGGLLLKKEAKLKEVLFCYQHILKYLSEEGIQTLHIKQIPGMYCSNPSEEIQYASFVFKALIPRVDVASTIVLFGGLKIQKNRMEGVKKGAKLGLEVRETSHFESFWNEILVPNLQKRHGAAPVHSVEEITQLHHNFPNHIKQFNVHHGEKLVAGATIFEMPHLVHVQYISSNDDRQQLGALDFLFHELITQRYADKRFFDFGTSNEEQGKKLNEGLLYWKECFGARSMVHSHYQFATENYPLLDSVFI